ncbi:MAG: hypothetical protein LBU88_09805 [Treponema sp.]|jgi:hypothetical protein|nr:hypothetical protein [Treponema sp.]
MNYTIRLLGLFGLFLAAIPCSAQNHHTSRSENSGHRRSAFILDITARVLEENVVVWNETQSKTTIPGRAVGIKLVGSNIIVTVQFTPFIRRSGNVLVAQGQIWIEDQERGMSYYTSIQTIPMEFNEPIHFFPLGTNQALDSSIEIIITINPVNANSDNE